MKGVIWEEEGLGAKYHDIEIPDDMLAQAKEYREKMIEAAVELDDAAMTAYLDGQEPDEATLKRLIRRATIGKQYFSRSCAAPRSRTRACSPALMRWSTICLAARRAPDQGHRQQG